MPYRIDSETLQIRLQQHLAAGGPTNASDIGRTLGISQASVSRLISRNREAVLVVGRARATRYAARRTIADIGKTIPVYEVDETGGTRHSATLHPVLPAGFYVESHTEEIEDRLHDDLPYFLHGLRPAGFLGRLLPGRHPELELPQDVRHWSGDDCLSYLTRYGWNSTGSFLVGDRALELYLSHSQAPPDAIGPREREARYALLVADVLAAGPPGSLTAGEQPKFLATLAPDGPTLLVKFSPPLRNPIARRTADLLVAEHLALELLREQGFEAPRSKTIMAADRMFLEVERFDRLPGGGRRGVLSLFALEADFAGTQRSWSGTAQVLLEQGRIDDAANERIRCLELFGHLIANSDMHPGNLSFFSSGERLLSLTPIYDMLPAFYAPKHGAFSAERHRPPTPSPAHSHIWESALAAARAFWAAVSAHELVSKEFRRIAAANLDELESWSEMARRLPT